MPVVLGFGTNASKLMAGTGGSLCVFCTEHLVWPLFNMSGKQEPGSSTGNRAYHHAVVRMFFPMFASLVYESLSISSADYVGMSSLQGLEARLIRVSSTLCLRTSFKLQALIAFNQPSTQVKGQHSLAGTRPQITRRAETLTTCQLLLPFESYQS